MVKESKNIEKSCMFFASDYHFEMISLPYINKSLKENKEVIMMTENDLNGTIYKLLSSVNLPNEDKKEIINIDWNNRDINKFKQIKRANEEGKEIVVFIKGKENYINNINEDLGNWVDTNYIKVVDCYDINGTNNDVSNIVKKYDNILSTSGVEKLLQ